MIEFAQEEHRVAGAVIKVIGIGGAGGNTVHSLVQSGCQGIECIIANTDAQALEHAQVEHKIQIGLKATKGLGTGANPELGQRSAEEDLDKLLEVVGDANIVFLTGGMGGGTGSGGLPVLARALKEKGILSIAIVTKPFAFEGKRRARVAELAIEQLKTTVDTLIVIPNQKLIDVVDQKVSMINAFAMINTILSQSVKGISDIITKPGHINVDFADVRAIMKDMGLAVLGTGRGSGPDRALQAAMDAISSPLLENMSIDGARGVLLNITGSSNLSLHEISDAASLIYERADQDANIILGSVIDPAMGDEVSVTIIATGFNRKQEQKQAPQTTAALAQEKSSSNAAVTPAVATVVSEPIREIVKTAEPSVPLQEADIQAAHQEPVGTQEEAMPIDINDLDVPAFMRKKIQEEMQSR